ncbi:hypothetical protein M0805_007950 [Coniferiporia weirii]|nr:hypothetical protein M0805_007950 [Coniferiporia weirii]
MSKDVQPTEASTHTKSSSRFSYTAIIDALPPWVSANLRAKRSWKTLARCWLATWAAFVLILPDKSLRTLGNASFFCCLSSLMVPPNMPVQMFIFAISLMMLGMLLGWGFGAAAMRSAVAARSATLLRSSYQRAEQGAEGAANPDAVFQLDVFKGFFLDTRSSVVYGVFFGVFSFLFAVGRAYRPRLVLFFTFAQIFLDIFCTFGPLFPDTEYTILSSILISTGSYMAIGIVCCVFVFPETMNHSYLDSVTAILGTLKTYAESVGTVLELSPEDIAADKNGYVGRCTMQRRDAISKVQALEQKGGLINVEFSWGRWNGNDARALEDPLRVLVARMGEFYSFPKLLKYHSTPSLFKSTSRAAEASATSSIDISEEIAGDTELIRQLNSRRLALEAEHGVRIEDILPSLRESSLELRSACANALGAAQTVIAETNIRRWKQGSQVLADSEAALDTAVERLRSSLEAYKVDKRFTFVQPFLPLLRDVDENPANHKKTPPIRSLLIASSFAAQLVVSADAILDLLEVIRHTTHKRTKSRLWAPSGLRAIGNFLLRREKGSTTETALGEGTVPEVDSGEKEEETTYRRDPDSRPPSNIFQKCMGGVHSIYKWIRTPEAMFATKYLIVSVLLWLPAVFPASAYFYYVEKGVWALIMAQTAMNVYVSDQIYSMTARCIGTVCGLIVGLLVWYIGNGHGNGNPYGVAAAFGVFLIPVIFARIHAPPALLQPIVMFNATLALIVGYSWIDAHLVVIGNPGVGWPIAWKRFVLVMIGFAAATIMMLFPPASGRKTVRLRNATAISELSSLYSTLMSVWISEERPQVDGRTKGQSEGDEEARKTSISPSISPEWATQLRKRILSLAEQVQAIRAQAATAKFEGNIRGAWPGEEYNKLLDHESDMLAALSQLCSALQHLDPAWKLSLNRRTTILNPNFITDVMSTFALVSQSLRTGEPMHQILPTSLFDRLLYHHTHDAMARAEKEPEEGSYVERANSLEFLYFSTGVVAVSQVIQSLDEMHHITKRLCGEVPFKGFNEWKADYERVYGPL